MFFAQMEARSFDDAAENARAVSNVLFQVLSTVSDRLAELEVRSLHIAMFPFFESHSPAEPDAAAHELCGGAGGDC